MQPLTILGGGPAGLAVAYYAHQAGIPFVLYERSESVGGLCRTFRLGEHGYDSGAHRFHDIYPAITRDVRRLLELHPVTAPSRICSSGQFLQFPPTPLNLLFSSSPAEWARIGIGLWRGRRRQGGGSSFQDFAVSRFGERLARRFLLDYSAKVWGLPADQLSVDVATRRLNGLNLRTLVSELIAPRKRAGNLDGHFLYPKNGFGEIATTLAAALPPDSVKTGQEVTRIECQDAAVRRIHFASVPPADVPGRMVSTLPLNLLIEFLGDAVSETVREAARALRFRHVRLIFLRLGKPRVSNNASIYFPDPKMCVSRVCEPKNRSAALAPAQETSLAVEVPCCEGEELYVLPNEELKERVVSEVSVTGLIRPSEVLDWAHHFLENAYPIYSLHYRQHQKVVLDGLACLTNLTTLGRNGKFFYSHFHDQLNMGKEFVSGLR